MLWRHPYISFKSEKERQNVDVTRCSWCNETDEEVGEQDKLGKLDETDKYDWLI